MPRAMRSPSSSKSSAAAVLGALHADHAVAAPQRHAQDDRRAELAQHHRRLPRCLVDAKLHDPRVVDLALELAHQPLRIRHQPQRLPLLRRVAVPGRGAVLLPVGVPQIGVARVALQRLGGQVAQPVEDALRVGQRDQLAADARQGLVDRRPLLRDRRPTLRAPARDRRRRGARDRPPRRRRSRAGRR